ncbi:MAG: hypothetical protein AAGC60_26215 [Acidobacteriota bacterium]
MRRLLHILLPMTALCCLIAVPAIGQDICEPQPVDPICGDDERKQYAELAEAGFPAEELYEMFAHCAGDVVSPLADSKTITINNTIGSIFYEEMNGCGYHPQVRVAFCDVELKRDTWYGPFGPAPAGSNENVTFCFRCGGGWIPVLGTVHVTNDNGSAASPSYGFAAYAFAPPQCPSGGTGASFRVRSTLSWFFPAINPCSNNPGVVWGNRIDWDARDDP